jgi:hypothetical protein
MIAIALLFVSLLCDCFKSLRWLEVENPVLRHQMNVLHQRAPRRRYRTWADRALFAESRWIERSNDRETLPLSLFGRSCIVATSGYDFRKGQAGRRLVGAL